MLQIMLFSCMCMPKFLSQASHFYNFHIALLEIVKYFDLVKLTLLTKNFTKSRFDCILVVDTQNFFSKEIFQLDKGAWKLHSFLNENRSYSSAVSTSSMAFVFGGCTSRSENTYEYLPKNSTIWKLGKAEIPSKFFAGFAIATKAEDQILLIHGRRIVTFNVQDHTFKELPLKLKHIRMGHACAYIPGTNKIIIAGGSKTDSTEILDLDEETITMGSSMNFMRAFHGIGIVTVDDEDKLAVFGGRNSLYDKTVYHDSVEFYNLKTKTWELSKDIKLPEGNRNFGFTNVKYDCISKLLK